MLRSCLGRLFQCLPLSPAGRRRPAPRGARGFRPELVALESRTLPSTIAWLRPVGGDWDTPANWAGGRVPGANDTAVIPFRGITVTHATAAADTAHSLNSEAALDISAGSLTIDGGNGNSVSSRLDAPVTVSGGTLSFFNSSVGGRGALRNFATLNLGNTTGETFRGDASVAVDNEAGVLTAFGAIDNDAARPFVNGPSATLRIAPGISGVQQVGSVSFANGFTNQGRIEVRNPLSVADGTLINAPGATIDLAGGGVLASFDHRGTVTARGSGIGKDAGTVTNEGTITVNGSGVQGFLSILGGSFEQGGTVTGPGTLRIRTTTADFLPGAVNTVANLEVLDSTLTSPTPLTNLVTIGGSTVNAAVVNQSTLTIRNGSGLGTGTTNTINGALTNAAGATLRVAEANLTVTQGLTNNGSIELVGGSFLETGIAALTVTGGTLTNAPGGTITAQGQGGGDLLNAALDNQGTLTISEDTALTGSVASSGTINVRPMAFSAGDLTVNLTDPSAPFTNTGTITIDNLRALLVEGGDFANAGTVALGSFGTFLVTGNYTQTGGLTRLGGGVLTADGLVDVEGGVLAGSGVINANVMNNAELDVGRPGSPAVLTILGDYTQTSGGALVVEIGGPGAGTGFDQLEITGQATLDGTLTVQLINGFVPPSGDRFPVLTFGSGTGAFATLNGDGPLFTPSFDPTDVTLVAN
jgi:hypothetical protein